MPTDAARYWKIFVPTIPGMVGKNECPVTRVLFQVNRVFCLPTWVLTNYAKKKEFCHGNSCVPVSPLGVTVAATTTPDPSPKMPSASSRVAITARGLGYRGLETCGGDLSYTDRLRLIRICTRKSHCARVRHHNHYRYLGRDPPKKTHGKRDCVGSAGILLEPSIANCNDTT